jgi:hypothetical protein
MGSFRVGAVVGVLLLMTAAGCSTSEQGSPSAAQGSTRLTTSDTIPVPPPSTGTTTKTSTSKPPVSRPKSIDLSGTDGCKIINAMPAADFGYQGRTPALLKSVAFPGAMDCIVVAPAVALSLSITTLVNVDAEEFAKGAHGEVTRDTQAGFPAFTLTVPDYPASCFTGVNVSDGQMLYLQWRYSKLENVPPTAQVCENAHRATVAAMKVLGAS